MKFALRYADAFPKSKVQESTLGDVVRFVPKSELERARLIREARAIYDSIFPPAEPATEPTERKESPGIQD